MELLDQFQEDKSMKKGELRAENDESEILEEKMVEQEGMEVKVAREERFPNRDEANRHVVNHIPCRSWCEHCVKGKAKSNPQRRRKLIDGELKEPVVSVDYMFMHVIKQRGKRREGR